MDLMSDVLSHFLVKGRVMGLLSLRGDWAFQSPENNEAVFHLVSKGSVLITFKGKTTRLHEGDMAFFTQGHAHILSSASDAPFVTFSEEDTQVSAHSVQGGQVHNIVKDGNGPETSLTCVRFDFGSERTVEFGNTLPDQLVLRRESDDTSQWVDPLLRRIAKEASTQAPGALAALDGLLNLLFIHFMRQWLKTPTSHHLGWIRGLKDPNISKALRLLHADPAHNWSVRELAVKVGMSRSNFAARFALLTGEPPLRYLTHWRMHLAMRMLRKDPIRPIYDIAASVGYDSEASFSAAFKRQTGKPPGAWRKDTLLEFTSRSKSA